MELRLSSQSDNFHFKREENSTKLVWETSLSLADISHISVILFKVSDYRFVTKKFSHVSCNLVHSSALNPHGYVLTSSSYKKAIEQKGSIQLFYIYSQYLEKHPVNRSSADAISFQVFNCLIKVNFFKNSFS